MKILITGANGYLGPHIIKFFLEKNNEIVTLSREDTTHLNVKNIQGNFLEENSRDKAFQGIDVVLHLAGLDKNECEKNPSLAEEINVKGTRLMLESSKKYNIKKFIYFSSFHVYGNLEGNISEKTTPNPVSVYGKSKLKAEAQIKEFSDSFHSVILRLSNVYGLPINNKGWELVVNNFCKQSFENQKIFLNSSGLQKRNFISIKDFLKALDLIVSTDFKQNEIFNLIGNNQISILDLAKTVKEIYKEKYNKEISIEFNKNSDEPTLNLNYDTNKLKDIDFTPKSNLKEDINKIFESLEK